MRLRSLAFLLLAASMTSASLVGCAAAPDTAEKRTDLVQAANTTLAAIETTDPSMKAKIRTAYAYAVFPDAGKGGFIVGGGGGRGVVYQNNAQVGWASFSSVTVGAQIGGQGYSMVILFENQPAFDNFKAGGLKGSATASGVAVEAGAAENAGYKDGVLIFSDNLKGLMGEASVGGTNFNYMPLD